MADILTPPDSTDKTPRRAIPRRLRYEILRRDNHACRYCGAVAPDVKLTVDHVIPVVLGGSDDPSNLVTACADCNGGKTSSSPDAPIVADVASDALRWAAAMRQAQEAEQRKREARASRQRLFLAYWNEAYGGTFDLPKTWATTVDDLFLAGLPGGPMADAVDISALRPRRDPWTYFCGVAWNKVTELQEYARAVLSLEED